MENNIVISTRGLKKDFEKLNVLKGIDIDIHKGDVVCVIGASGSGKSTFLRCLNLLEQPTDGSITFEGVNDNDSFFGNPFRSVTSFIVKGDSLTVDPNSKDMSGIECEITYLYD